MDRSSAMDRVASKVLKPATRRLGIEAAQVREEPCSKTSGQKKIEQPNRVVRAEYERSSLARTTQQVLWCLREQRKIWDTP